jgi:hypothetical protein
MMSLGNRLRLKLSIPQPTSNAARRLVMYATKLTKVSQSDLASLGVNLLAYRWPYRE